jgi:hypothetical protein
MHGADQDLPSILGPEYCGFVTYGKTVQSYCFATCVVIALSTAFLSENILLHHQNFVLYHKDQRRMNFRVIAVTGFRVDNEIENG